MSANPIPLRTRRQVAERSGFQCECGCGRRAAHIHHRRLRSQGGTNDLANLIHLAHDCHRRVHANPRIAYDRGLLVHSWSNPADVPVISAPQEWSV